MFSERQIHTLGVHLRSASADASVALARWIGWEAEIVFERVQQAGMAEAAGILGDSEQPIAACLMTIQGWLTGHIGLAFDDASGLAVADLVVGRPVGTSSAWGELEQSAVQETSNIVGCAYLNALARISPRIDPTHTLLPTPPLFHRDYAPALLEFALVDQAQVSDLVLLTETEFRIEGSTARWDLLFIPDAEGLLGLKEFLAE